MRSIHAYLKRRKIGPPQIKLRQNREMNIRHPQMKATFCLFVYIIPK